MAAIASSAVTQSPQKWVTSWTGSVQGFYPIGNPSAQPDLRFAFPSPEIGARDQSFRLIVRPDGSGSHLDAPRVSGFDGGAPRRVKEVLRSPAGTDAGFFVAQDAPRTDPDSTTAGNPGLLGETARRIDVMPTITAKDGTEIFYRDFL